MKTKLTLFVTVLATALFVVGCASVPKPDVANAIKWNGHWYTVYTDRLTWDAAKMKCEKLGGHLVIVESEAEDQFSWDLVSKEKGISGDAFNVFFHIGCHGSGGREQWKWVNGQPVTYSNWNKVAPLDRRGFGGIALTPVKGYPAVKPKEWVVHDSGSVESAYICEWE